MTLHIIVCLDDRNGLQFLKRRLSSDQALCQRVLDNAGDRPVRMNAYSAALFPRERVYASEDFLETARSGDVCFVENTDITPYIDKIHAVTLYRWNRAYPSDVKFPVERFADRWKLQSALDFPGNSHDTITEECYCL